MFKLKIGTKLELELVNNSGEKIGQSYVSQIADIIDSNSIQITAPIHESKLMLITTGTRIRCFLLHESFGLICFYGLITGKEKKDALIFLDVKHDGNFEKIQRRKYFRLDCNLTGVYRQCLENSAAQNNIGDPCNGDYIKTITKNLSGSGASIVTEEEVSKGSYIDLILQLSNECMVKAICKVIRCTKIEAIKEHKYDIGLYFHKISQRDQDLIVKYIFDKQRALLKNNLAGK